MSTLIRFQTFTVTYPFILAQKVLKFEFAIEVTIMFIKKIKKGIDKYVHFIGKSII